MSREALPFLALGILAGYLLSAHYLDSTGPELERCLTAYLTKAQTAPTWETAAGTLWCFFRAGICAFLLGFRPSVWSRCRCCARHRER